MRERAICISVNAMYKYLLLNTLIQGDKNRNTLIARTLVKWNPS